MTDEPQTVSRASPSTDADESEKPQHGPMRRLWENWIKPFAIVVIVLSLVRSSLADWNDVPTGSMNPTILEGDRIFVNKLAYSLKVPFTTWTIAQWSQPERGQIVTFWSPKDGKRLIKRVAGVPGDRIEMRDRVVLINGEPLEYTNVPEKSNRSVTIQREQLGDYEHAVQFLPPNPKRPSTRNFKEITLGPDEFFMLGDNRDNSGDSRAHGVVPLNLITGHAFAVAVSRDGWAPRWERFFMGLE